ncbi:uncharacterized protein LOC132641390 [Lycium barbarum]|uniref:uncharacterized protein LOC132641390 n=1 Tax=Lycium barbarum TaxID=112863 RepID=UPI00293E0BF2|nr:uncharacterized protein LOC132641390 [Lycium barbarum]
MVPSPGCNCEKSKDFVIYLQRLKVYQFLMGLNDTYAQARSHILMMTPLPSVNQVYSMMMSDESQKAVAQVVSNAGLLGIAPSGVQDSIVMYSKAVPQKGKRNYYNPNYNPNAFCDHCKLKGHFKKDCYKLVRYPLDFPRYNKHRGGNDNKGYTYRNQDGRNYDHRDKQRRTGPRAHNVIAKEGWNGQTLSQTSGYPQSQQGQMNNYNIQQGKMHAHNVSNTKAGNIVLLTNAGSIVLPPKLHKNSVSRFAKWWSRIKAP